MLQRVDDALTNGRQQRRDEGVDQLETEIFEDLSPLLRGTRTAPQTALGKQEVPSIRRRKLLTHITCQPKLLWLVGLLVFL